MNEPLTVPEAFTIILALWCFGFSAFGQFMYLWRRR